MSTAISDNAAVQSLALFLMSVLITLCMYVQMYVFMYVCVYVVNSTER